ncbi:MAG: GNAT family N-acetyltransferase [Nitrososphaerales archaeon]|nr:GNAT family N-acetyltransferase [Nitrososphaerales archaeon]
MKRNEAAESVRTRPIEKADYMTVSRIYREEVKGYLTSLRKARRDQELREERRSIRPNLLRGEFEFYQKVGCSFVAVSRNKIIGFILTQPISWMNMDSRVLWLEYIAVSPAFRDRGVGSALMASARKWAARRSISCRFATLNPDNKASRALLRKGGFEVRKWLTARYPSS